MKRKLIFVILVMSLLALALPAVTNAGGFCGQFHTVQSGETLYRIAKRYGTTVSYLSWFNQLPNPNRIEVGQQLCIRPPGPSGTAYTVKPGDNLFRIALNHGVNLWSLAQHNNIWDINRIYVGQVIYIPDFTIQY